MEGCGYCKERESKIQKYEEEIRMENMIECKKALEREKIAKGMQCTRIDEIQLRTMQKLQMEEKKYIEQKAVEVENMWHQVLLHDVRNKEEKERKKAMRLKEEMFERRKAYDEQITSANRDRRETLRKEREEENQRLEKMKQKMEQDYYEAIKYKRDQQMTNRMNLIKGHEMKLTRIKNENNQERQIDATCISVAEKELRKEKQKRKNKMIALQQEKSIFLDHYEKEKKMAKELEKATDEIIHEWKTKAEFENDEHKRREEIAKQIEKEKALNDYRQYLEEINHQTSKEHMDRKKQMERVQRTAYSELQRQLNSANEELRKQIDYRKSLTDQINNNQKVLETELKNVEYKQRPFTKKPFMFKDAMRDKVDMRSHAESTNPIHPFRKVIKEHCKYGQPLLPHIRNFMK